jgi:hypothetical protein
VPVTVTVLLPGGVEPDVVTVIVEEPSDVMVAGLKLEPAPDGSPLAPNVTVPLNPLMFPTVTV